MFYNSMGADMDVMVWLRGLGLGKYEAAFRENEIDETVLPNLTADDLKELGVDPFAIASSSGRSRSGNFHTRVPVTMSHHLIVLPDDTAKPILDAVNGKGIDSAAMDCCISGRSFWSSPAPNDH